MAMSERYIRGQLILYNHKNTISKPKIKQGFYVIMHIIDGKMLLCKFTKENKLERGQDGNYLLHEFSSARSRYIYQSSLNFAHKFNLSLIPSKYKNHFYEFI